MAINITRFGAIVNINIMNLQENEIELFKSIYEIVVNEALANSPQINYKEFLKIDDSKVSSIRERFMEDSTPPQPATYPNDTKALIDGEQILPALTPTEDDEEEETAPMTTPATPVSMGVVLDNDGLPWDARIHSSKKTKTPDGKWRLMRGVNLETVQVVKNELRATMNLPPAPVKTAGVAMPVPPPPASANVSAALFAALVNKVTAALGAQKLTQAQLVQVCQSVGLPNLPAAGSRPDLIPNIDAQLTAIIGG